MAGFPKTVSFTGLQIQNEDGSWRTVPGVAKVEISPKKAEITPQVKSTRAFHFGTVKQPEEYLDEWDELNRKAVEAGAAITEPSQQILDAVDKYAERAGVELLPWQKKFIAGVMANPDRKFIISAPRQQGLTAINKTFEKYYEHKKEIEGMTAGQPIQDEVENVEPYSGWKKSELRERIEILEAELGEANRQLKKTAEAAAAKQILNQRAIVEREATITTLNRRITNQRTALRELNKHVRDNALRRAAAEEANRTLKWRNENNREYIDSLFKTLDELRAKAYPAKPHWWSRRPAVDAAEAALARLQAVPAEVRSPGVAQAISIIEQELAK